ncbi:hypothetical protein GC173_06265 [bacterium]|nr:hypothetical protein [bacterium]
MKKILLAAIATLLPLSAAHAQNWATITTDGDVNDWTGITALLTDVSGDGGAGRDIEAIYVANDASNLYVRIQSYNSIGFDGNEFIGIDGDNSTSTGFSLFGQAIGSDTLLAGAAVFGETTASFNSGAATPANVVNWGPFVATTDVELAFSLATTIPGDISSSIPGGLGSTIGILYGDGDGSDVILGTYTLASSSSVSDWMTLE